MTSTATQQYIAFLRGINVGGHHKVPMAELRKEIESMGYSDVITLLNSGNIIFNNKKEDVEDIEKTISVHLEKAFNFPIPVVVRKAEDIQELIHENPFEKIEINSNIRLYVSFLNKNPKQVIKTPWAVEDKSFQIIQLEHKNVFSVLDLSKTKSVKGMEVLEKLFGKNITTRNWNTLLRISKKLEE